MPTTSTAELLAHADRFLAAMRALHAAEIRIPWAVRTSDRRDLPASVLAALDEYETAQRAMDETRMSVPGGGVSA